jgi:hypothetical protein
MKAASLSGDVRLPPNSHVTGRSRSLLASINAPGLRTNPGRRKSQSISSVLLVPLMLAATRWKKQAQVARPHSMCRGCRATFH